MITRTRRASFPEISGDRVLDLVNTVGWRLAPERQYDDLVNYHALLRWGRQMGLLSAEEATHLDTLATREPHDAAREWGRVVTLREAIYAALMEGEEPRVLAEELADAICSSRLERAGMVWEWHPQADLGQLRRRITFAAHRLLTDPRVELVRQCGDEQCGWIFLDTSPRRNRRWCVSSDCGNRNRARDFYRRSHGSK